MIDTKLCMLWVSLAMAGCETATNAPAPCEGAACAPEPPEPPEPPESYCLEQIAAGQAPAGCGIFISGNRGDDANDGSRQHHVSTFARAVALARVGRGRIFVCPYGISGDAYLEEPLVRLPSGVDLIGRADCLDNSPPRDHIPPGSVARYWTEDLEPLVTVEPARPEDTGAADGISTLMDLNLRTYQSSSATVLLLPGTTVEILRSEIHGGVVAGDRDGELGATYFRRGENGWSGENGCDATSVAGEITLPTVCDGVETTGGKGGDSFVDRAGDGEDGLPAASTAGPRDGRGGAGDRGDGTCQDGHDGADGEDGQNGASGQGHGRLTEAGWIGDKAGDGTPGKPGQGGGGSGALLGGLLGCGRAGMAGPAGGSGGSGGCAGKGGTGGWNGAPSLAIAVLHGAKLTVRDTLITTTNGERGGRGGRAGRGGTGGYGVTSGRNLDLRIEPCLSGNGGKGGDGGFGGNGRGGDSIGIAYLDEGSVTLGEGVTFELGLPGRGGESDPFDAPWAAPAGSRGEAHEMFRYPE
jgi:hypothetical protein